MRLPVRLLRQQWSHQQWRRRLCRVRRRRVRSRFLLRWLTGKMLAVLILAVLMMAVILIQTRVMMGSPMRRMVIGLIRRLRGAVDRRMRSGNAAGRRGRAQIRKLPVRCRKR